MKTRDEEGDMHKEDVTEECAWAGETAVAVRIIEV